MRLHVNFHYRIRWIKYDKVSIDLTSRLSKAGQWSSHDRSVDLRSANTLNELFEGTPSLPAVQLRSSWLSVYIPPSRYR